MKSHKATSRYYKELDRFVKRCKSLVRSGGAYLVIIANHELFRFLYPYEPYLSMHNSDPVNLITEKIIKLNDFLKNGSKAIKFYDFDVRNFKNIPANSSLENKTSDLYTSLWNKFEKRTIMEEGRALIEKRIPKKIIDDCIKDKTVLDMGCGSGRYSIALSLLGAKKVYALDLFEQSYKARKQIADERKLNIEFLEGNFHNLPFKDNFFDFIFCNGTIHHSTSIEKSLKEFKRVLKEGHKGFLYLYAKGGIFWNTRDAVRKIFKGIPSEYTNEVLKVMFLPSNRFIFADVWHVPIEKHTSRKDLERMLKNMNLRYTKVISNNIFDLDRALDRIKNASEMWGEGEHRYILEKAYA